jgi:acyl carrier protein
MNWKLSTISEKEIKQLISKSLFKQIDDEDIKEIDFSENLINKYELDSVDLVSILLDLEQQFTATNTISPFSIPTDKMQGISTAQDLVDLLHESILKFEESNSQALIGIKLKA